MLAGNCDGPGEKCRLQAVIQVGSIRVCDDIIVITLSDVDLKRERCMLDKLWRWLKGSPQAGRQDAWVCEGKAPQWVEVEQEDEGGGGHERDEKGQRARLYLPELIRADGGAVLLDWQRVYDWIEQEVPAPQQAEAWLACERGWLLHLRDVLGAGYVLMENAQTFVLSSLEQRRTVAAMAFIDRTRRRIMHTLQGVADDQGWGKDILVVCDDVDAYFSYIAAYYPDEQAEIARSSGVYLNAGCGHFVTMDADLLLMEPVIVHELTHSYVSHLPLPLWLNEGIAVNVEQSLAGRVPGELDARQMQAKHESFWSAQTIQGFWSGEAFGQQEMMSQAYDLAATLVKQLSQDWPVFARLVQAAQWQDSGAQAVQMCLGMSLGNLVCAMLGKAYDVHWEPASGLAAA